MILIEAMISLAIEHVLGVYACVCVLCMCVYVCVGSGHAGAATTPELLASTPRLLRITKLLGKKSSVTPLAQGSMWMLALVLAIDV